MIIKKNKKSVILILFLIVLSYALVGCSKSSKMNRQQVSVGTYVMQESKEPVKPFVSLEDNNKFIFTYSALSSSYIPSGSYEVDNDILTLKTEDDK